MKIVKKLISVVGIVLVSLVLFYQVSFADIAEDNIHIIKNTTPIKNEITNSGIAFEDFIPYIIIGVLIVVIIVCAVLSIITISKKGKENK